MAGSAQSKHPLRVALGVVENAAGELLVSQRQAGTDMAGAWEFPGGKLIPGETPLKALQRELLEELGIRVRYARHLAVLDHDYGQYRVCLHCWKVLAWEGAISAAENQPLAWVAVSELMQHGLLAADQPLLERLTQATPVNDSSWKATVQALEFTNSG